MQTTNQVADPMEATTHYLDTQAQNIIKSISNESFCNICKEMAELEQKLVAIGAGSFCLLYTSDAADE